MVLTPANKIDVEMEENKNSVIKVVLEIVKLVATALLGYFGGNAIVWLVGWKVREPAGPRAFFIPYCKNHTYVIVIFYYGTKIV